jgi:hypothetical protein
MAMFAKLEAKMAEQPEIELVDCIDLAIGSIINNLLFGYRFNQANPIIHKKSDWNFLRRKKSRNSSRSKCC